MNIVWRLRSLDTIYQSYTLSGVFTSEELAKIKLCALPLEFEEAKIFESDLAPDGINKNVRVCGIKWIKPAEDTQWLYKRLVDAIYKVNSEAFNLNLYGIEPLQYTVYDAEKSAFYSAHRDSTREPLSGFVRKLSFSLQLTDPSEYEGGDLMLDQGFKPYEAPKNLGNITFFNSSLVHEAKPVTKGVRHVLVGWVSGPPLA